MSLDETSRPLSPDADLDLVSWRRDGSAYYVLRRAPLEPSPSTVPRSPPRSLEEILGVYSHGPYGRRRNDPNHSEEQYEQFLSFVE